MSNIFFIPQEIVTNQIYSLLQVPLRTHSLMSCASDLTVRIGKVAIGIILSFVFLPFTLAGYVIQKSHTHQPILPQQPGNTLSINSATPSQNSRPKSVDDNHQGQKKSKNNTTKVTSNQLELNYPHPSTIRDVSPVSLNPTSLIFLPENTSRSQPSKRSLQPKSKILEARPPYSREAAKNEFFAIKNQYPSFDAKKTDSQLISSFLKNKESNAFPDIVCGDYNIYKDPQNENFYYHANYVQLGDRLVNCRHAFLLCQAPKNLESQSFKFWKMVWNSNSTHIINLTSDTDGIPSYWPPNRGDSQTHAPNEFETISINNTSSLPYIDNHETPFFSKNTLRLSYRDPKGNITTRNVTYWHFSKWERNMNTKNLDEIVDFVKIFVEKYQGEVVTIHDRGGIGRAGILVSVFLLILQKIKPIVDRAIENSGTNVYLQQTASFDYRSYIPEIVGSVRRQRNGAISRETHYTMIYDILDRFFLKQCQQGKYLLFQPLFYSQSSAALNPTSTVVPSANILKLQPKSLRLLEARSPYDKEIIKREFSDIENRCPRFKQGKTVPGLIKSFLKNKESNAFKDIFCADHNIYKDPTDNNFYYHANYVQLGNNLDMSKKRFILCQGPQKCEDLQGEESQSFKFWKMVWNSKSTHIINLTSDKDRILPYWPRKLGDVNEFGSQKSIKIKNILPFFECRDKEGETFYSKTTLDLSYRDSKGNTKGKKITYWHMPQWPDHGTVDKIDEFVEFIKAFTEEYQDNGVATIHCRAGVGRSGTLAAILLLIEQMNSLDSPNSNHPIFSDYRDHIQQIVENVRSQRNGAVQKVEQYQFIYDVLDSYFLQECKKGIASPFEHLFAPLHPK